MISRKIFVISFSTFALYQGASLSVSFLLKEPVEFPAKKI